MPERLAVLAVGGIGVGNFAEGLPTMGRLVQRLAVPFDTTYYSLVPTHPDFTPAGYRLRSPPPGHARDARRGALWPGLLRRFLADHRRAPYDVLLSFWGHPMGAFVAALGRLLRRPSTAIFLGAELADIPALDYGALRSAWGRRVVRATCAGLTAVVLVSTYQRELLTAAGFRSDHVHLIPWGGDRDMFPFARSRPSSPLKIVHVANLTAVKDQATLVRAFAIVRRAIPARLRIVGGDFLGGAIQRLAATLGLGDDVSFVGPVPYADVQAHYRWADMFILSSLSEGQNSALTEAVTSGLLGVSTRVGVASDLGEDGAVLFERGEPEDLARKVIAIAGDPAAWDRKVTHARRWAEEHDFEWTVARTTALLEKLARDGRA